MSRFITIKPGVNIKSDDIEGVIDHIPTTDKELEEGIVSIVYTHHNDYPSVLPSETVLQLIDMEGGTEETEETEETGSNKIVNLLSDIRTIQGEKGNFAG